MDFEEIVQRDMNYVMRRLKIRIDELQKELETATKTDDRKELHFKLMAWNGLFVNYLSDLSKVATTFNRKVSLLEEEEKWEEPD